ncbi:MAG: GNAT family N-acetyltransferase, partial [Rhizobium rhizophilum]
MTDTKTDIRLLSKDDTLATLPDLCETLADCVEGGASL